MERIKILNFSRRMKPIVTFCEMLSGRYLKHNSEKNKAIFIVELDEIGENEELNKLLKSEMKLRLDGESSIFEGMCIGLIVKSHSELYTKSYAQKFIFLANSMGGEFIGHPMVEIINGYKNFKTWQRVNDHPLERICFEQIDRMIQRLSNYKTLECENINILVLHAGYREISNSLMLWEMIRASLFESEYVKAIEKSKKINLDTLHVEEGRVSDCYGCQFQTCMYYAKQKSCFYGGFVVEDLYPKLEKADIVVWICPNYNDAISAKLMAVINRLTAFYRQLGFKEKYLLAVVVSGNSGGDSVGKQLLGALCINKGFRLPPKFAITAIANEPGEIHQVNEIENLIRDYVNGVAKLILENLKKN